jgi:hypothetical protein
VIARVLGMLDECAVRYQLLHDLSRDKVIVHAILFSGARLSCGVCNRALVVFFVAKLSKKHDRPAELQGRPMLPTRWFTYATR